MNALRTAICSFLGLSLLALGKADAEIASAPVGEQQDGMVWRVSGGKVPFFLAGSLHVLRPSDYPLPAAYEIAWKEATHLVMELPAGEAMKPENQAVTMKLAFLSEGKLKNKVSPEVWKKVTEWCQQSGYPEGAVNRMKPWMASLCIAISIFEEQGLKSDLGLERHFTARLAESGKTSEGLETFEQQLMIFDRVPEPLQEAMLRLSLEQVTTMKHELPALLKGWRTADTESVDRIMSRSMEGFPDLKKQILGDRNQAWIPRLEALLQGDRATMVLVGAGHLCGPGNVVELLQAKGYQCVPVKAAAALPAPVPAPAPVKKAA